MIAFSYLNQEDLSQFPRDHSVIADFPCCLTLQPNEPAASHIFTVPGDFSFHSEAAPQ